MGAKLYLYYFQEIIFLIVVSVVLYIFVILAFIVKVLSYIYHVLIFFSLENLNNAIILVLKIFIGAILLIFLLRLVYMLSKKSDNIVIAPFEVYPDNKTYSGKSISDRLIVELRKIRKIHQSKCGKIGFAPIASEKIYLAKLTPEDENFETKVFSLGEVKIAGISFSLGNFFIIFKELWPLGGPVKKITGSLQDIGSDIHLIALMEGPNATGWSLRCNIAHSKKEEKIQELVKSLAYNVTHEVSKNSIQARTCEAFKYFTESRYFYL